MIFLLKDGRYKTITQFPGDRKFHRKYMKCKRDLAAIMIECFSLLHSDVYTMVLPDNFQLEVEPMLLTYSICHTSIDEPINESNILTRTIQIKDCVDLYTTASLIYQLSKNDDVMNVIGGYELRSISILSIMIETKKNRHAWTCDESSFSAIEFVNEFGFICDTDKFLDAAVPKAARVEQGSYYVRYDKNDGFRSDYYYYDRKAKLYMTDSHWCLELCSPQFFQESNSSFDEYFNDPQDLLRASMIRDSIRESDLSYTGFCINGTGLLYLCVLPEAIALDTMDCFEISLDIRDEIDGSIEFDTKDIWGPTYMASNALEVLYLGLYVPQMLEIERFLFSKRIRAFTCEFIHRRSALRAGSHEFPEKMNHDMAVEFDLLAVVAKILLTIEPTTVSYDDMI